MEHISWGIAIAFALFLAGLGAGAYIVAVMADLFGKKRYQKITRVGALAAPWPVILGVLLLVIDLGKPLRFWEFLLRRGPGFLMFNRTSVMSIGVWLLTIFVNIGLIYAALNLLSWIVKRGEKLRQIAGAAGLIPALLVTVYTGVLLAATPNPLWNTVILPAVFSASAMSTGIAAVVFLLALGHIYKQTAQADSSIHKLEIINSRVIGLELLIVILFILAGIGSASMKMIISRGLGVLWWVGVIVLGLIIPLFFSIKGKAKSPRASLIVAALELFGGVCLRYVILIGGQIAQ
jgi:formate-dependent nitrite reductase membrane component NrfD